MLWQPGKGTPVELLSQCLPGLSGLPGPAEVAKSTGLEEEDILEAARELERDGRVKMIIAEGRTYLVAGDVYRRWAAEISDLLRSYHREYPLREGYPKE